MKSKQNKIYNPLTKRWVKRNGKVGKSLRDKPLRGFRKMLLKNYKYSSSNDNDNKNNNDNKNEDEDDNTNVPPDEGSYSDIENSLDDETFFIYNSGSDSRNDNYSDNEDSNNEDYLTIDELRLKKLTKNLNQNKLDKLNKKLFKLEKKFIKEHPDSHYGVFIDHFQDPDIKESEKIVFLMN